MHNRNSQDVNVIG